MSRSNLFALLLCVGIIGSGCRQESDSDGQGPELAAREQRLASRLAAAQGTSGEAPLAKWILPEDLREVSGIALTADGRLLAHSDERGRIYVIDPRRGMVVKTFSVGGKSGVVADFEGITTSGDDIYMLVSNGTIYKFREGADGASVPFTKLDTGLGRECEFEGITIDPDSAWFVLPCKSIKKKNMRGQLVIYRWRPDGAEASVSVMTVPLVDAVGSNGWKRLSPSDIAIDPLTGNYVLITGPEKALIEISSAGEVVQSRRLPGRLQQPEGIAISRDGILMISDESVTKAADITLYRWPLGGKAVDSTTVTTSTPVGDSL